MSETTDKTVVGIPDAITQGMAVQNCVPHPTTRGTMGVVICVRGKFAAVYWECADPDYNYMQCYELPQVMTLLERGQWQAWASEEQPSVMVSQDCNQTEKDSSPSLVNVWEGQLHFDEDGDGVVWLLGETPMQEFLEVGKRYRITELPEVCTPTAQRKEGAK